MYNGDFSKLPMSLASLLRGIIPSLQNPMAPGNMKSEFVGLQRNKIISKGALSRKALARIGENVNELASSVNMAMEDLGAPGNGTVDSSPKAPLVSGDAEQHKPGAVTKNPGLTVEQDPELLGDCKQVVETHEVQHLKALSMLHLDVIEQQQQQIQRLERELQKGRAQNDTLKARLERIQRRTVLAQKHQDPIVNNVHVSPPVSSTDSNNTCKRKQVIEHTTPVKRHHTERESTPTKSPAPAPSPVSTPTSARRRGPKLQTKDKTKEERPLEVGSKLKDVKKNGEMAEKERGGVKGEQYLKTDVIYPCLSDLRVTDPDPALPAGTTVVQVPSWRLNPLNISTSTDNVEDIEDGTFERRHQKYEVAEQKRKRWDIQRVRELREHERLEQKMLRREYGNWDDILKTFYPEPSDACQLQVSDTVPLVAFGVQVPVAKDCEFELPWYDVSERDKEETRRQTRSRTNRK
ncbi:male-specific lethal 1 homolog isoform X1 [Asterias rubens]|uniref:male-specific lethal 1 homolog isoform X1 n=1 Tax=Asterias rubens TaxID=7604 RepID=UPI0014554B24|nr:male-specific lethal 1 homolog isoform X1 [Asterias rubens]